MSHPSHQVGTNASTTEEVQDLSKASTQSPALPSSENHVEHPKEIDGFATITNAGTTVPVESMTTSSPAANHTGGARRRLALSSNRLLSLDLLRGLAIFIMITVNAQNGPVVFPILSHPEWIGLSIADTVFPSFLFITGCTMPLSIRAAPNSPNSVYIRHAIRVFKRSLIIWGLGVILNLYGLVILSAPANQFRWPNVLNRIGFCYLIVAWMHVLVLWRGRQPEKPLSVSYLFPSLSQPARPQIHEADSKRELEETAANNASTTPAAPTTGEDDHGAWPWFVRVTLPYYLPIACLVIWLICTYSVQVEGCPEKGMVEVPECSAQAYFDLRIFGKAHTYRHLAFDPEGALSTLTSILNVWLGWFIGCTVVALNAQVKEVNNVFKARHEALSHSEEHEQYLLEEVLEQEIVTRIYSEHLSQWFWWGILWMFVGWLVSLGIPLSKPSWTATFAVVTSGISQTMLAILFFKFDAQPKTKQLRKLHLEHQLTYRSNNQLSRHYHHRPQDAEAAASGSAPLRSNYSSALNVYFKVDHFFRHWFRKGILLVLGSMGRNAILLYMCSELVQGTCYLVRAGPADPETGEKSDFFTYIFSVTWGKAEIGGWGSLLFSLGFTFLHVLLAIFLDYKKWYFKV
ncbi:hypothetical protein BCR41DRAFT_385805 [Lobosporangium transversale]|uniref:Heparan-alpha-glucosaminide N-acetyltransferase catalytic domain-containing protein n=1 Tax=Lobosporangium transversale TaxID=64571 RepID=A0A1Y2GQL7_9FUNG|nr:hypothetical protein BCR41DRAFT_385805 [Lobosporangium transversale]ORZ19179.1 hypothetical protein BCR41DRAFT_385805 [Lobosporangium transversale]|eukprot:XP_021882347.1 hypothetical protein BCR41DRAFT_385805 [Lobosporangium transversale]